MDEEIKTEGMGQVESSADAIIIAEGLFAIADALGRIAKGMNGEEEAGEEVPRTYLDGSPIVG